VAAEYRIPALASSRLEHLRALTLVHGPRAWGKTTLMAYRLSPAGGHKDPVHWIHTDGRTIDADFVSSALSELDAVGSDSIARHTLVLDDLAEVDPAGADAILRAVDAADGPNVVLIARNSRSIRGLALLASDSVTVGPQHLRVDAEATLSIAQGFGVDLHPSEARALSEDYGGWPGLIRGVLAGRSIDPRSGADSEYVLGLARHILEDFGAMGSPAFAGLLVPEVLSDWVLDALLGEKVGPGLLSRIEAAGSLVFDGGVPRFVPGVRRLGLLAARAENPGLVRDVATSLLDRAQAEGDVRAELFLAAEAEDRARVRSLLYVHWEALGRLHGEVLHDIAVRAPEAEVKDDPRLVISRDLLTPDRFEGWLGRYLSAGFFGSDPHRELGPLPKGPSDAISALEWRKTLILFGLGRMLAVDAPTAAVAFHQALKFHPEPAEVAEPESAWASDVAVHTGLAIALAFAGAASVALPWADRVEDALGQGSTTPPVFPRGDEASPGMEVRAAQVVPALVRTSDLINRLDPRVLEPAPGERDPIAELWTMFGAVADVDLRTGVANVLTSVALVRGEADSMLAELERRMLIDRPTSHSPAAGVLLQVSAVDLCLARGDVEAAAGWLESLDRGPRARFMLEPAQIRLMLAQGRNAEVLDRTENVRADVVPRYAVELWLARAAAAYREGLTYVVREAVERAAELAREFRFFRPFLWVPVDVLRPVVAMARPLLGAEAATSLLAEHQGMFPAATGTVTLTDRESAVLRHLASGATVPEIARSFVVAPSTVRTHVSSLYRKLGVSTRPAAIHRAGVLRLL
jgi:LuxR family maltose regulon positive regulatory protein